jgi:hypothetical protein
MAGWTQGELAKIVAADDLHIAPFREDETTYGTPTWIWCVAVDGGLYVRGYNGRKSRWYQAALRQKAGRIIAAGMTRDVTFESIEGALNDCIDAAYKAKYSCSPYLAPMIGRGRAARRSGLRRAKTSKDEFESKSLFWVITRKQKFVHRPASATSHRLARRISLLLAPTEGNFWPISHCFGGLSTPQLTPLQVGSLSFQDGIHNRKKGLAQSEQIASNR